MPDPSDTGFFTLSESEMVQQDRKEAKVRRRHRHTGLKVFLVLLLLIVIAAGGLGFAYTRGLGFPSQESVVTDLFQLPVTAIPPRPSPAWPPACPRTPSR